MHLVVVPCAIFSSYLSIYHTAWSFVILDHLTLCLFKSCSPLHRIGCSSLLKCTEIFADCPLNQASKINYALSETSISFRRSRDKCITHETLVSTHAWDCVGGLINYNVYNQDAICTLEQHLYTYWTFPKKALEYKRIWLSFKSSMRIALLSISNSVETTRKLPVIGCLICYWHEDQQFEPQLLKTLDVM